MHVLHLFAFHAACAILLAPSLSTTDASPSTSKDIQNDQLKQNLHSHPLYNENDLIYTRPNAFYINGKPTLLLGSSFQWFRMNSALWNDRLLRLKGMGYVTLPSSIRIVSRSNLDTNLILSIPFPIINYSFVWLE